ncbi:MAG TPA: hypothetical protein VGR28_06370 [Candidatus Thermoplasmatota archaeon]|jgi:hypothetical protein|nr:hypothetical protein [Candidatus Thermoplasmatota archaeon]
MPAPERLAAALRQDGFEPVPAEAQLPVPQGLAFLGVKDNWGSLVTCSLALADGLGSDGIAQLAARYHELIEAQLAHTGHLRVPAPGRAVDVRLGSFGVLCLVFERGCSAEQLAAAREAKRIAVKDKASTVVWAVDVPSRKVHRHKGLPLGVIPKPQVLEGALA